MSPELNVPHQRNRTSRKDKRNLEQRAIDGQKKALLEFDASTASSFSDFPLSVHMQRGLQHAGFTTPTDIQRSAIPLALCEKDVLGTAKTGSGKTLAFLIPVLECLWRHNWTKYDGLGALIISPTRELAYQIYEVLRRIGKHHSFSAALVIGGTDAEYEKSRLAHTNIMICTPGRLLQHMDENYNFNCDSLKILVLDEADRILDMGFEQQLTAVVENLPTERQTLLFSATLSKKVEGLARLSLDNPVCVDVHETEQSAVPDSLQQTYVVCEYEEKLNFLWSFLRNHTKKKILVFMACCKQVRYVYHAFKHLRPGLTVLALHGAMSQHKRVTVYEDYTQKDHAVLFATDIAARGLDFPRVDWVLHFDCPADPQDYIHRSGRTARAAQPGASLLLLAPHQVEPMLTILGMERIELEETEVNPKRLFDVRESLSGLCAQAGEMKKFAQSAFVSYMRCLFLLKNKVIFDLDKIDMPALSRSMGLSAAPRVRFLQKNHFMKNKRSATLDDEIERKQPTADDDDFQANNMSNPDSADALLSALHMDDVDEDVLTVKRKDVFSQRASSSKEREEEEPAEEGPAAVADFVDFVARESAMGGKRVVTREALARKIAAKKVVVNTKMVFEDEDEDDGDGFKFPEDGTEFDLATAQITMEKADLDDKAKDRARVKDKHKKARLKAKEERAKERRRRLGMASDDEDECAVTLGGGEVEDVGGAMEDGVGSEEHDLEDVESAPKRRKKTKQNKAATIPDTLEETEDLAASLLNIV